MGHNLSKSTASDVVARKDKSKRASSYTNDIEIKRTDTTPPTINLEIARSEQQLSQTRTAARRATTPPGSLDSAEVRQIIIKIQLAKMENGNDEGQQQQQQQDVEAVALSTTDKLNANMAEQKPQQNQIINVTLNGTAGGSMEASRGADRLLNNNNLAGSDASASATAAVSTLQLHDNDDVGADDDDVVDESLLRRRRSSSAEGVDYCEVLEPTPVAEMWSNGAQQWAQAPNTGNSCCRSRSSKAALTIGASATPTTTSKRRCCKCKCRAVFNGLRGMLESSSSSSAAVAKRTSSKERRDKKSRSSSAAAVGAEHNHRRSTPPTLSSAPRAAPAQRRQRNSVAVPDATAATNQLAIWTAPSGDGNVGDVIIRISSPQFVVQPLVAGCPGAGCSDCTSPIVSVSRLSSNNSDATVPTTAAGPAIRLLAPPAAAGEPLPVPSTSHHMLPAHPNEVQRMPVPPTVATTAYGNVIVHSQIDFRHCLVPDLERIINSSFYWGKMDRYEAERLLEGKPEGTFLLRDSAQEEYLFSVTFRKYGRSLHARIEQSGHKFSFDCHDPCVFTAPSVTGLLEHYKDPSCVMFFEPCLTMPLHRRQTFSLQQLARATIVSNTTYDGINQLELPCRLKSYLKEYHYKQKLRVKPCDMHTPYYTNI
ncbi:uncharacterized protein LOC115630463 [Scaptodrosophila lebanonensis]|uniref:Uncharacterized protein LOC115630463 n=1 Tax=Drosophila lebanonensis TaxID=7225 RepID=A0A6J2U2M1_DROLE|nr:uncharacterized protein LOC115630463 [Scaptodrosophila lebanonensis]